MQRITFYSLILAAVLMVSMPASIQAQIFYAPPRPVVVVAPPITSYYAPAPSYYAPAPRYSYYPPVASYSYYPTTVYAPPASVAIPVGTITTRTYYGLGIFRPLGYNTETYYTPYAR